MSFLVVIAPSPHFRRIFLQSAPPSGKVLATSAPTMRLGSICPRLPIHQRKLTRFVFIDVSDCGEIVNARGALQRATCKGMSILRLIGESCGPCARFV